MIEKNKYRYELKTGDTVTRFLHSDIKLTAVDSPKDTMDANVGMVEGYFDVEYPVRRDFLTTRLDQEIIDEHVEMKNIYSAYEGEDINFSAFISTPHRLECQAVTYFECEKAGQFNFEFKTCGGGRMWVNGELCLAFDPFTRNHPASQPIQLNLTKGVNKVVVYFDDLAERDTTYCFELKYQGLGSLQGFIPLAFEAAKLEEAENYLASLFPEKDCFINGKINIINLHNKLMPNWIENLIIRINPQPLIVSGEMQDGNITEFKIDDFETSATSEYISLGQVSKFKAAGLTKCEISLAMPDGTFVRRLLKFAVYDKAKFANMITGETLAERKTCALKYFASLELDDVNVGLIKLLLDQELELDEATGDYKAFATVFPLIEAKGDCADFVLAPLLAILIKYPEKFPQDLQARIKDLSLQFRYWIDEPGNDVMWYFSENHALLFHAAQYLAGHLYPKDDFTEARPIGCHRVGFQQRELGKLRLLNWFKDFLKYGFSEWNSITYLPIDLIGFFSLYIAAPDEEIKALAKMAIDATFELTAIHLHHGAISSTYGRVYEHNLKTTPLGEMTNLTKVAWDTGYFNNALRATALFAISDYEPEDFLQKYINLAPNESLTAEYIQGINQVQTYQYKTDDYSLASAINYQPYKSGYQQHLMNISLGKSNTHFWINHPGERKFSGEGRPSYWAGNGSMPLIYQHKNVMMIHYDITDGIDFIHLYFPHWDFEVMRYSGDWLFLLRDDAYAAIYFSNSYQMTIQGAITGREIKSLGREHFVVVKCSSKVESGSFERFSQQILNQDRVITHATFKYTDAQYGTFELKDRNFHLNGEEVLYHAEYEKKITIEKRV